MKGIYGWYGVEDARELASTSKCEKYAIGAHRSAIANGTWMGSGNSSRASLEKISPKVVG